MADASVPSKPIVTHQTSTTGASNTIIHRLRAGAHSFTFEEDSKVSIYMVNGNQIARFEDAIIRALIAFRDQVSAKDPIDSDDELVLSVLDHEIDRQIAARRRAQ